MRKYINTILLVIVIFLLLIIMVKNKRAYEDLDSDITAVNINVENILSRLR